MDAATLGGLGLLALLDSTSVGTLVLPLVLLAQPVVRSRRVVLYLATVGAFYLALGIALLAGATWLVDAAGSAALTSSTTYVVQAALGAGLVALSFRYDAKPVARRKAARGGAPTRLERWWTSAAGERATVRATVTLALGAALVEVASMLPYLAAVGIISTSAVHAPVSGAVLLGYVAVMLAPAAVLLVARLAAGDRLTRPLTRAREWLRARTAGALGTVIGLAGLLLLLDALRVLGGRGLLWW